MQAFCVIEKKKDNQPNNIFQTNASTHAGYTMQCRESNQTHLKKLPAS
jgi:hypothetical protein